MISNLKCSPKHPESDPSAECLHSPAATDRLWPPAPGPNVTSRSAECLEGPYDCTGPCQFLQETRNCFPAPVLVSATPRRSIQALPRSRSVTPSSTSVTSSSVSVPTCTATVPVLPNPTGATAACGGILATSNDDGFFKLSLPFLIKIYGVLARTYQIANGMRPLLQWVSSPP